MHDAINLQIAIIRLQADATRRSSSSPTARAASATIRWGAAYSVYYDLWGHPSRFIDELGRETDQAADGLGRVTTTTYPEGDFEQFSYDGRGKRPVTDLQSQARQRGSDRGPRR